MSWRYRYDVALVGCRGQELGAPDGVGGRLMRSSPGSRL